MPCFFFPASPANPPTATAIAAALIAFTLAAAAPGQAQSLNPGDGGLTLGPAFPTLSPSVAPGSGNVPQKRAKTPAKPAVPGPFATPRETDAGSRTPDHYQPGESLNATQDTIVATVDGIRIRLSDVGAFVQTLPPEERALPYEELFPRVVNTLIGQTALVAEAYRLGLDKDPAVETQVRRATNLALQGAALSHAIKPLISESNIHARYRRDIAGKPGPTEIELGLITVATEADAKQVIAKLQAGADFAALAKQDSRDPSAFNGGNLGWVTKEQMKSDISAAALALQAGQTWPYPLHLGTGWNVIKVLGRRDAPTPSYEQAHDALRRQIILEAVSKATAQAIAEARVERFNMDGKPALALGPDGLPVAGGAGQ